jgi:DNA-directed RNA polymerase specialized sigma24 family protein
LKLARGRKLEPLEDVDTASINAAPDAKLDLEKAMAQLSLPQRASLTMCFALGYSHEEAAAILEMPVGTLKSHIARGRERTRQLLEYER